MTKSGHMASAVEFRSAVVTPRDMAIGKRPGLPQQLAYFCIREWPTISTAAHQSGRLC